ncbi:hypothetical protein BD410DRAFT_894534 [Rickenella mellea]|uniref:Small ribosomal subunit protein mS38 n=1 Tax=Rickenella mellea TaxID=50990 RepID=A0A4Y7QJ90_9AGAM|nr:hypothetical protein BD410DRAFT_894534 [Rickenella mellea]
MSRLARLLPPLAGARRAYSFFSSKPGGGRYPNSTKPPKVSHPRSGAVSAGKVVVDHQSNATHSPPSPIADTLDVKDVKKEYSRSQTPLNVENIQPLTAPSPSPPHPMLKPHELKLHHFFSLHRPLLLINQAPSILFKSPAAASAAPAPTAESTIDNPPEASPEADADAARQLSRALVMSRVGNAVDWEVALQRFGMASGPIPLSEGLNLSSEHDISMDSTQRKRRRKMKKHKLKKRRRLQRFERLRLGK